VLTTGQLDFMELARKRRNGLAHSEYNETLSLAFSKVEDDVRTMLRIARMVQSWRQSRSVPSADGSHSLEVSPAIFGLYLEVAGAVARTKLLINDEALLA